MYHIRQRCKLFYPLITVIISKADCIYVNQLESLVQKVQGCILQLVMFIFSKQELRNVKRHLKYQLSFMMNLYMLFNVIRNHKYCVSRAKLFTSDDIELNPGPAVTQGNNPNVVELLQFQLAQCNMA